MPSKRVWWGVGIILVVIGGAFLAYQAYRTNLAHTTFERYYAFRGCTELIDRTATYADCKLANGQTIRMVLLNDRWYLEGDGPGVW